MTSPSYFFSGSPQPAKDAGCDSTEEKAVLRQITSQKKYPLSAGQMNNADTDGRQGGRDEAAPCSPGENAGRIKEK